MENEKTYVDYSKAIESGVYNWLSSRKDVVDCAIASAITKAIDPTIEALADGVMKAVGKFLNDNNDDIKSAIAIAIATCWANRQHPVPNTTQGKAI